MTKFRFGSPERDVAKPASLAGKLFISVFFAFFLGMGLLFVGLLGREMYRIIVTYTWKPVECTIITCGVTEGNRSKLDVRYRYEWAGKNYESTTFQKGDGGEEDIGKVQRLAERYRPGSKVTGYVNPANPAEAVLKRQQAWIGFFILIPLVFVAVGAGGIYGVWRKGSAVAPKAISQETTRRQPRWLMPVFFGVFLLAGLGFSAFFLRAIVKVVLARDWPATPCVVLSSEVKSHSDSDGTTYSVNIAFEYEVNGARYKSNRYDFLGGSSSGYRGKKAIVDRYRPKSKAVCYVNPRDPHEAVLNRNFTPVMLVVFLPLVFVGVGAGGLVWYVRGGGRAQPTIPSLAAETERGPIVLKPAVSPWMKFFGIVFACVFWNGIVSVFFWQVVDEWRHGRTPWGLTLFLTPFVLIGLLLIGIVVYQFLALFNPRVRLTVSARAIPLGGTLDLSWELTGRASAIDKFRIELVGREEATYRRGTTTTTDKETFARVPVMETTLKLEMVSGHRRVTIPADTMHTFTAPNNKIVWLLEVSGEIPQWPDLKEEFPINITPKGRPA